MFNMKSKAVLLGLELVAVFGSTSPPRPRVPGLKPMDSGVFGSGSGRPGLGMRHMDSTVFGGNGRPTVSGSRPLGMVDENPHSPGMNSTMHLEDTDHMTNRFERQNMPGTNVRFGENAKQDPELVAEEGNRPLVLLPLHPLRTEEPTESREDTDPGRKKLIVGAACASMFAAIIMDRLMEFGADDKGAQLNSVSHWICVAFLIILGVAAFLALNKALFKKFGGEGFASGFMGLSVIFGIGTIAVLPALNNSSDQLQNVVAWGGASITALFLFLALCFIIHQKKNLRIEGMGFLKHTLAIGCLVAAGALLGMNLREAFEDGKNDGGQHGVSFVAMSVCFCLGMWWIYKIMGMKQHNVLARSVTALLLFGIAGCLTGLVATVGGSEQYGGMGDLLTSGGTSTFFFWGAIALIIAVVAVLSALKYGKEGGKCLK